jgi:DNA polymerase III subunit delta'
VSRGEDEDRDGDAPPPRETAKLFGHGAAEREFLTAYRSGRIPHAWLIGGEAGIGKATLAYRMARFVLAYPDPSHPAVTAASSLALDPAHPTARRVAANAHSDLLVLERSEGENGKMRTVITVDQVRRLVTFFGSTAGEGGWRVCIVDSADELKYPEGSNALLKMLEEPPARALFLLVSHAPDRLLPTIKSRCRRLALKPLGPVEVARAATAVLGPGAQASRVKQAAEAAGGSVARALALAGGPRLELRQRLAAMLDALPAVDAAALHAIGDQLDRDRGLFGAFVDAVRDWLSGRLDRDAEGLRVDGADGADAADGADGADGNGGGPLDSARRAAALARLAGTADLWDRLNRQAREAETYNLDRKPVVFGIFGLLAEASGG